MAPTDLTEAILTGNHPTYGQTWLSQQYTIFNTEKIMKPSQLLKKIRTLLGENTMFETVLKKNTVERQASYDNTNPSMTSRRIEIKQIIGNCR